MGWLPNGGFTLGPNANHQSLLSDGDCGFWSRHANSFAPTSCLRQPNGVTGSDVVTVSQTGHLESTDYVGQASRRYRK